MPDVGKISVQYTAFFSACFLSSTGIVDHEPPVASKSREKTAPSPPPQD